MINLLRFLIWRYRERYYKRKHILRVVTTSTGVKLYNPVPFRLPNHNQNDRPKVTINPNDLFIGPDFLKDKYTLLDSCIAESPHRTFIEGILNGQDMLHSEYMNRLVEGKLDGRPITLRPRTLLIYKKKCEERYAMIKRGDYEPVQVYNIGGKYYIKDGKHRAALCAILDVPVKCEVIAASFSGGITFHIYKMIEDNPEYTKNSNFFKCNKVLM